MRFHFLVQFKLGVLLRSRFYLDMLLYVCTVSSLACIDMYRVFLLHFVLRFEIDKWPSHGGSVKSPSKRI